MENIYNDNLDIELKKIFNDKWNIINNNWDSIIKTIPNRTKTLINNNNKKIKSISSIQGIKNILLNKLGPIPVYFFINILFGNYDYSGNYNNVEKGIMLLYHLIIGGDKNVINYTMKSYKKVFDEFYIYRYEELNERIDKYLKTMFSNIKIRILNSRLYNNSSLKTPTFIFDTYSQIYETNRSNKSLDIGYVTQYLCDNNGFIIYVFNTKEYVNNKNNCKINYNELLFWDINLSIDEKDVITIDEEHTKYKQYFISNTKKKQKNNISNNNFISPFINDNLSTEDILYNTLFNNFHFKGNNTISQVEELFQIFKNKNNLRTDIKIYNLQLKICILLYNIYNFIDKYNIKSNNLHKSWIIDNFDFPKNNIIPIKSVTDFEQINPIKINSKMEELQIKFLELNENS